MSLFTDKCKIYIPRFMKDTNTTLIQASGVFGNIGTETGGFKFLQEIKPVVKGSAGGYGWQQWTGVRRRKYLTWCKNNYLDPATDEANYRYLVKESTTDELASLEGLRKTTTLKAATETWMLRNLRPGVQHLDSRLNYATQAYNAVKDSKLGETAGAGAVIIGGTATAAQQTDPNLGIWILVGTLVLAGLVWFFISQVKNTETHTPIEYTPINTNINTKKEETPNVDKSKSKT